MKKLMLGMVLLAVAWPALAQKNELRIYHWNDYIAEETVARFEKQCKCKVVMDYFGDNEELVAKLEDTDQKAALEEIRQYNAAVRTDIAFNPNVKDGRCTKNLRINKSNWANTLDTPPFEAYAVTCGITFSFGGLKINTDAQVMSSDGAPIPGLYAAGELVGGIFWFNYPGGTGLTNGAVFGRIAGANAGKSAA